MRTPERHARLRQALTDAAERAIAAGGLRGLRAREIAREAGCALGAIYTVFPDLDALVYAVNGRTLDAVEAALDAAAAAADPAARLVALALAYCNYAAAERPRWSALFAHGVAAEAAIPPGYRAQQARLLAHVEAPLAALRPDLPDSELTALARSVFAAVHGVVALGLEEKLAPLPPEALRAQLRLVVAALARGLAGAG